jgi:hypothetical protein
MKSGVKIVAHRARGFHHPENSLPALIAAFQSPVDEIEIDVRRCSDATWVVHHSPFLPGFSPPLQLIKSADSVTAKRKKIPLLDEVFELSKSQLGEKTLRIEFKDSFFPETFLAELANSVLADRVVITAWSLPLLREVHSRFPALRLCLSLIEGLSIKIWNQDLSFLNSLCVVPTLSRILPIDQFRLRNLSPDLYIVSHSTMWGAQLLTTSWCKGVLTKDPMPLLHLRDSGLDQRN